MTKKQKEQQITNVLSFSGVLLVLVLAFNIANGIGLIDMPVWFPFVSLLSPIIIPITYYVYVKYIYKK